MENLGVPLRYDVKSEKKFFFENISFCEEWFHEFFSTLQVNEDSTVIAGKWVMCEDEREIIYDGSGAGHKCPMPFLYDNIYFDYCTRKSNTSPFGFNDYYWCPDPRSVEADNLYTAGDPVGKCTSILVPEGK